jgi:MoxR-like ATPase
MTNNKKEPKYEYTAEEKYQTQTETKNDNYQKNLEIYCPYPYIPSNDLKEAVNLAIKLERPLLLEGEPGCGKTRLAGALAYEFTKKNQEFLQSLKKQNQKTANQEDNDNIKQWWDYYIWNIKSTTRARDGLYRYDAVARLRDAQLMGTNPDKLQEFIGEEETDKLKERLKDKKNYLEFGALGKALGGEKEHNYRPILLIDEIDKADSDFANDLLLELEELRFGIPETGDKIEPPTHKPIIFITSNREKPLPEPFLRRCIYFYVGFPEEPLLKNIINKRFGSLKKNKETLVKQAIDIFYKIRKSLQNNPGSKPPGTSEFIDFINALLGEKDESKDLTKRELDKKKEGLDDLSKKTPLLGILIKSKPDYDLVVERLKNKENKENEDNQ